MLELRGLVKTFPPDNGASARTPAVDGISLDIPPGRIFTLLGPSGCGKTTTLRCIAGLETPDAGEIAVAGRLLFSSDRRVNVPASERGLGMVFQSYAIWPHMTVWEHAAFPLVAAPRRRRPPRAEILRRAERALAAVRLERLASRRATDLSGGEQQRLALARALVLEPPLLLLDEPLSNLDVRLRQELREELLDVQREVGVTSLYVTHDQEEALAISETVAVMRGGRIEQVGTPADVYDRPGSRFVADFLGRANLVEGVVQRAVGGATVVVRTPEGELRASGAALAAGQPVTVIVRPERVELSNPPGRQEANGWLGTVRSRAFLGDAVEHVVDVGRLELRVRTPASSSRAPGTSVAVRFPGEPLPALAEGPRER
jgi:iron(III) transport system ATP-binding protein